MKALRGTLVGCSLLTVVLCMNGCSDDLPPAFSFTPPVDDSEAPKVVSSTPAANASDVALDTSISITFDSKMNEDTITVDTVGTTCKGSIQVSATGFADCLQMTTPPTTTDQITYTIKPASNLTAGNVYKVKVSRPVMDASDNNVAEDIIISFDTGADTTAPTVQSTAPADNSHGAALNTTISVSFNELMNSATITTNTASTACSGSLQVSSDNFATCIQMSAAPSVAGATYTVTPSSSLSYGTTYKVRITTAAADQNGNNLASTYESTTGFGSVPLVYINEVHCNGGVPPEDYVELYVAAGGGMGGWKIREYTSVAGNDEYTFDSSFVPATGDFIVLHYDSANQGTFAQEDDAGSTKNESSGNDNVNTAWDVYTTNTTCQGSDNFFTLTDGTNVVDSVAVSNRDGGISGTMEGVFANVFNNQATFLWTGFTVAADGSNDAIVQPQTADMSTSAHRDSDYTPGGGGVQDTNTNAEWCDSAATMGAASPNCP